MASRSIASVLPFSLSRAGIISLVKGVIFFILAYFLATNIANLIFGLAAAGGTNIKILSVNNITFDPLITLAYLGVYQAQLRFYLFSPRVEQLLFMLVMYLSYSTPFVTGSAFFFLFCYFLRKFKVV